MGHAMVLFTSYKPLKIVYELLKNRLSDYDIVLMSRGKKDAINEFKKTNNGVLFATGSAWEGVNIPGDLLSTLIIVKLPFPIPDPISEYERIGDTLNKRFGDMKELLECLDEKDDESLREEIKEQITKDRVTYKKYLDIKLEKRLEFIIIEKKTMRIIDQIWSTNNESTVVDYLWCPFDVLPNEKWTDIIDEENELRFLEQIC